MAPARPGSPQVEVKPQKTMYLSSHMIGTALSIDVLMVALIMVTKMSWQSYEYNIKP